MVSTFRLGMQGNARQHIEQGVDSHTQFEFLADELRLFPFGEGWIVLLFGRPRSHVKVAEAVL